MSDVIDILTLGVVVVGGYLVISQVNQARNTLDSPNNNGGTQWNQPDVVYPDHPFHGVWGFDDIYDAGWNTMAWMRTAVSQAKDLGAWW